MDPVNPAPAGNPQLTTHLLVSHKKNKNFHPSKVSLKRVKVVNKQTILLGGPVPSETCLNPSLRFRMARSGRKLRVKELLIDDSSKLGAANAQLIRQRPWTVILKFQYEAIVTDELEIDNAPYVFQNLVFDLKLLDWDGKELLHVTEKDVSLERFHENLMHGIYVFLDGNLENVKSFETTLSWNEIWFKVEDSELYSLRDTQPINRLSAKEKSFFVKLAPLIRKTDETIQDVIEVFSQINDFADKSKPFQNMRNTNLRLSQFLEYLWNQAKDAGKLSSELRSLIRQMLGRLVYLVEPMIVAIVRPVIENPDIFTFANLALKMQTVFELTAKLQTFESFDDLSVLGECLFCDWSEMLTLLVVGNNHFYSKHLKDFVKSTNRVDLELLSRFLVLQGNFIHELIGAILEATDDQNEPSSSSMDSYCLASAIPKYQCWWNNEKLAIVRTPNEFMLDGAPFGKLHCVDLNFHENHYMMLKDIAIFKDRLIFKGAEEEIYVCDVKKILSGPTQQALTQVSSYFRLETKCRIAGNRANIQTLVGMGETSVAQLRYSEGEKGKIYKIQVYDFDRISDNTKRDQVKITEFDLSADDKTFPHSVSGVAFQNLPRNLIAVGYYFKPADIAQASTQPKSGIRMMLFHYRQSSSEVVQIADNHFGIEVERFAQLPSYSSSGDNGCKRSIFGFYKQRVFCLAGVHPSKIATQIYCFYLNKFIPIGGTNCRTPGLYVWSRNQKIDFTNDTTFGGLCGHGWFADIDRREKTIQYKLFEMRICF